MQALIKEEIDILFTSETRLTMKSYFTIPKYKIHCTNHPDGKAHGGSAIIIRDNLNHCPETSFETEEIQATNISVEDLIGQMCISYNVTT